MEDKLTVGSAVQAGLTLTNRIRRRQTWEPISMAGENFLYSLLGCIIYPDKRGMLLGQKRRPRRRNFFPSFDRGMEGADSLN